VAYDRLVLIRDCDLAAVGRAIAEPSRAAILLRLMDGQAHSARDLATAAGIKPPAASAHLRHLVSAGLVAVSATGRQRLHALASPEVAAAIEALATLAPLLPAESLRAARAGSRLRAARACYSHLGGSLAVAITDRLTADHVISPLVVGQPATVRTVDHPLLAALGISELPAGPGPAARGCPDWTERTPHLAGRLGTAMLSALIGRRWLARRPADRALTVTEHGQRQFSRVLSDTAASR
jgi:DNA-binding transcriptional ArsR family regulator